MKEEDIIQAANEYIGHAEEIEEDLSAYCNRKSFEAGAKWMQEKMIEKACDVYCKDCEYIGCDKFECLALEKFRKTMEEEL